MEDDILDDAETDYIELSAVIKSAFDDAEDFNDSLGYERNENSLYYRGEAPVEEAEGHSNFVSTDVSDAINFLLPQLMRTFLGSDKVVEFIPTNADDVEVAEQQTDYINYVINQKNSGYMCVYSALKDALIRKAGFIKAYYSDEISVSTSSYTDLDAEQFAALAMKPENEIIEQTVKTETVTVIDEMTGEEIQTEVEAGIDVTIRREVPKDQVVIEAVPPEEILIARNARCLNTAHYVSHRSMRTVSDLVGMGYDFDTVLRHAGKYDDLSVDNVRERITRNPFEEVSTDQRTDDAGRYVMYCEHYVKYDLDEDGINELVRVCTIGINHEILNVEPWDDLPIVMFSSDPEPHTAIGRCPADQIKPIQQAKSQILSDTLDSLGHSVFPRMAIVDGQVNIDDVLNTDVGQPIRMRQVGAVQPLTIPFVGGQSLPMLEYFSQLAENRTGVSASAGGLRQDQLQSTTAAAVNNTISNAQGRIETIARNLAETGMKSLFQLVNKLTVKHMDRKDVFRLRNKFVPVDPRVWDMDKDVIVNVALSGTSDQDKVAFLMQIVAKQEQAMRELGMNNPLVSPQQYANTMGEIIRLSGFKDVERYINQQMPPAEAMQPPEQPQPDPAMILAQAEIEKNRADNAVKRMDMLMEDDRKRDELETDAILKAAEIQAKYGTQVNVQELRNILERDKEELRQRAKLAGMVLGGGNAQT